MLIPVAYMIRRSISCIFAFPPLITRSQGIFGCHSRYNHSMLFPVVQHSKALSKIASIRIRPKHTPLLIEVVCHCFKNFRNSKVLSSYIPTHYKHLQAVALFTIAQHISIDPSSVCIIKSTKPDKPGDPTTRFPHPPIVCCWDAPSPSSTKLQHFSIESLFVDSSSSWHRSHHLP